MFIADVITRLDGSCRQSLFCCSFVEAERPVYMALVVRVTSASVQLCFGGFVRACHIWQSIELRAPLWVFWGESLALLLLFFYIHMQFPQLFVVPFRLQN